MVSVKKNHRVKRKTRGIYERCIKRPLDILLSTFALVVLSPVYVVIACMVRVRLGSPVIFKQERPGLNEKIFILYKFRTMTNERDKEGRLLPDSIRLTKFGKWLRSTSCDEIPEFLNILKGDMSIVGPRPLLVEYLDRYNAYQKKRHEVRPGLTGYAQVYGRNGISWEEKFKRDVHYVRNVSFYLDVRIIIKTIEAVLKREGINSETAATMEEFVG